MYIFTWDGPSLKDEFHTGKFLTSLALVLGLCTLPGPRTILAHFSVRRSSAYFLLLGCSSLYFCHHALKSLFHAFYNMFSNISWFLLSFFMSVQNCDFIVKIANVYLHVRRPFAQRWVSTMRWNRCLMFLHICFLIFLYFSKISIKNLWFFHSRPLPTRPDSEHRYLSKGI